MQSSKLFTSTVGVALITGLSVSALLPSCAFKRLTDWDHKDTTAANAESLEEALAILDRAIEETAPASEISSLPLDVPTHPEDLEAPLDVVPVVTTVPDNEFEFDTSETLFALEDDRSPEVATTLIGASEEAAAVAELDPAEPVLKQQPRERIVVNRPTPKYGSETATTAVFDEFRIVRTTAYSHTEQDHIQYGELSAMGKPLRFGMVRSAAADWSRYPVGTRFRIVGKPYEYVVDDYGSALVGTDTIDLYKPSTERMDDWGAREVEIEIIAWGSFGKSVEILEPRRKFGEHVTQMIDAITSGTSAVESFATSSDEASIQAHD